MSENAQAIIAQAVKGDRDTSALISILLPEWIESGHDAAIVRTIIDLSVSEKPISPKTIAGRIAGVVGVEETKALFSSQKAVIEYVEKCENPDGSRMKVHAEQIKLDHIKREIRGAVKRVVDSLPTYQTAEDAASGAIEILAGGVDVSIGEAGAYNAKQAADSYIEMRDEEASGVFHTWEWPFPTWQRYSRFKQSQVTVFAAPSESGKSWFGVQMLRTCCKAGDRAAYFTGEMTPPELIERLVLIEMGDGKSEEDALAEIESWDFVMYDGTITIEKIQAATIRAKAMGRPFHMVVVDHIHLMDFPGKESYRINMNRALSIFKSEIANRMKCGIILLAQLRKQETSAPNQRPRKDDIRESKGIENIADWIFLMARTNEDEVTSTDANIWNDKRRGGKRMPTIEVHISDKKNRLVEGIGEEVSAVF
jgi:replicative DNA helicase